MPNENTGCIIHYTDKRTGQTYCWGCWGLKDWTPNQTKPFVKEVATRKEAEARPIFDESWAVERAYQATNTSEWNATVIRL